MKEENGMRCSCCIARVTLAVLLAATFSACAAKNEFNLSGSTIDTGELLSGGPGKDGIPAISRPKFVSVERARFLKDSDLVVGFAVGDGARAYPISILNYHEIVNDTVGNQPAAVTWCPLTATAVVFDRRMQGRTLEFGVSGLLYNSNVVMYDRIFVGLWSQMLTSSVSGRQAGAQLEVLPSRLLTWGEWREAYPDTLVLSRDTGHRRNYDKDPYTGYHRSPSTMFPVNRTDNRLPAKSKVLGLRLNGVAKAFPLGKIPSSGQPLVDTVGGVTVSLHLGPGDAAYATGENGNLLPGTVAYWFAWSVFNPDTKLAE